MATSNVRHDEPSSPPSNNNDDDDIIDPPPIHVVFVHLDLGIGGAEQLVLQLARASSDLGHRVDIVTTRCDQDHCFEAVKRPDGVLSQNVSVYGRWIPPRVFGMATALMSAVRVVYLTYKVVSNNSNDANQQQRADVVVVDVLPTSLPLLLNFLPGAGILFYCHFPDKLLLRNNNGTGGGFLKRWYRRLLDAIEEYTMDFSDTLVVNSRFTLGVVEEHFPVLSQSRRRGQEQQQQTETQQQNQQRRRRRRRRPIEVLYPALDTSNMVRANNEDKTNRSPIVSLNRFERKKNTGLLIEAYAHAKEQIGNDDPEGRLPPLVIAGGYDTQNAENVEYRGELGALAKRLGVEVDFRLDISDKERATLFQTALCVVYTPDREHFGIVPIEAMYAGTPVLAVASGGPLETVRDGETGFLREPTPEAFGEALLVWTRDPGRASEMGKRGRGHVETTFGTKRLEREWKALVEETKAAGAKRRGKTYDDKRDSFVFLASLALDTIVLLVLFALLTLLTSVLRQAGVLGPHQSILGAFRSVLLGDEL